MVRVSIIEDDRQAREALAVLFNGTPGFKCLSSHHSAESALKSLPLGDCDVVIVDISLPGMNGIECVRQLKQRRDSIQILMLTVHEDSDRVFASLKAGASGYLLKRTPMAELVSAIQDLHGGGSPMSSAIARRVTQYFHSLPASTGRLSLLTDREREVLDLIARGRANKQISQQLGISPHTVDNHLRSIYGKLHVQGRTEAAATYLSR